MAWMPIPWLVFPVRVPTKTNCWSDRKSKPLTKALAQVKEESWTEIQNSGCFLSPPWLISQHLFLIVELWLLYCDHLLPITYEILMNGDACHTILPYLSYLYLTEADYSVQHFSLYFPDQTDVTNCNCQLFNFKPYRNNQIRTYQKYQDKTETLYTHVPKPRDWEAFSFNSSS